MVGSGSIAVPFDAHIALLEQFLAHRRPIVERIQDVLNAQRKPVQYLQDRALLSRIFEDCFFSLPSLARDQSQLRGQIEQAHWESGFRPRQTSALHNDIIHPAEMMIRGFFCWHQTRWPGRNGRVRYAETLFNVYLLRQLELLSMRIWDDGSGPAGERLGQIQTVLDVVWRTSPIDQPVLVRDAHWLIPLAQSPTTDELAPYFEVAERVATLPTATDRVEIQRAAVLVIGGHLRSQIRHYCLQDRVAIDEESVVRRTRTSNALDFALLIQGLTGLLAAYESAVSAGDVETRKELAGAICQAISPDPEVFLNRVELLGAYSMIEHLFVAADSEGRAGYTPTGNRHLQLLQEYEAGIARSARSLLEDCDSFRPSAGSYSPYGAIFGTPSNLTEHMALKAIERDAETDFCLEDVFVAGGARKLAWVDGWRKLPHIDPELQKLHVYPQDFADDMFARVEKELRTCVDRAAGHRDGRTGRIHVLNENARQEDAAVASVLPLGSRFLVSSDTGLVAAGQAQPCDRDQIRRDRFEGHFAVSYETPAGWVGIRKDFLTDVLGTGQDVRVDALPAEAASVLRCMCPGLVAGDETSDQDSVPPSMLNA